MGVARRKTNWLDKVPFPTYSVNKIDYSEAFNNLGNVFKDKVKHRGSRGNNTTGWSNSRADYPDATTIPGNISSGVQNFKDVPFGKLEAIKLQNQIILIL